MVIWREDLKILHKGIVLVAVPLALNLLILGASTFLLYMQELETKREAKSKDFNRLVNTVQRCYIDAGLSASDYVLTKDPLLGKKIRRDQSQGQSSV